MARPWIAPASTILKPGAPEALYLPKGSLLSALEATLVAGALNALAAGTCERLTPERLARTPRASCRTIQAKNNTGDRIGTELGAL